MYTTLLLLVYFQNDCITEKIILRMDKIILIHCIMMYTFIDHQIVQCSLIRCLHQNDAEIFLCRFILQ